MITYFAHTDKRIEAAESPAAEARLRARGFRRISPAMHRALWWQRDYARYTDLWPQTPPPLTREVGR